MQRTAAAEWTVWTTTARVVVTDPAALDVGRTLVRRVLDDVDRAASRWRPDSEVSRIATHDSDRSVVVSAQLAALLEVAFEAARVTRGAVDPIVAGEPVAAVTRRAGPLTVRRPFTERDIALDGRVLHVPAGTRFDLGATAKAWAADQAARVVAQHTGCGVLVSLGGDLAVAGPVPDAGWQVLVQDGADEPADTVSLHRGALATSSTLHRRSDPADPASHHVLDPATGAPATPVWRTVSAVAPTCAEANAWTTAGIVWGRETLDRFEVSGVTARLVDRHGHVHTTGSWPS